MKKLFAFGVVFLVFFGSAQAQQSGAQVPSPPLSMPKEFSDISASVAGMEATIQQLQALTQQAEIQKTDFDNRFKPFIASINALKTQAATADYWRDACQSTPQCGGEKKP